MTMSKSLSSVVSTLVKASVGSATTSQATEEDLDRHIAELILKEAKQKAERYGKDGIRAYINEAESNAPRTNKRFLSSIIKNTDDHNRTIQRAQAQAAEEIKREREEAARQLRKARAEEAADAALKRRRGRDEDYDVWNPERDRGRRKRARERERSVDSDEYDDGYEMERHRKRSRRRDRSHSHERSSRRRSEGHRSSKSHGGSRRSRLPQKRRGSPLPSEDDVECDRRKRQERSRDRRHSSRRKAPPRRHRDYSPDSSHSSDDGHERERTSRFRRSSPSLSGTERDTNEREAELRRKLKRRDRMLSEPKASSCDISMHSVATKSSSPLKGSTWPPPSDARPDDRTPTRSLSPGPPPPPSPSPPPLPLPSKMDKYFEASYDPRLDVAPLSVPKVPATGLINSAEFEGWDAMLELLRQRREDKLEKKRLDRLGLSPDKRVAQSSAVSERWAQESTSLMTLEYKKKGSVREWDLGKEGL